MTAAFILVQIGNLSGINDMRELHKTLHAIPGVKTVHLLTGPTDMMIYVESPDQAGLMETIGKIRGSRGVATTDTRIVMPV